MDPVIGGLLGLVITAIASILVASIAKSSNRGATTVEFAKAVVSRLEKVEDDLKEVQEQLSKTRRVFDASILLIRLLVEWGKAGGRGRLPEPDNDLREYLNPAWWAAHDNDDATP